MTQQSIKLLNKKINEQYSIESYFTICHSAIFPSQVSITIMENKSFKLDGNQSTKLVSVTKKKNKLFEKQVIRCQWHVEDIST